MGGVCVCVALVLYFEHLCVKDMPVSHQLNVTWWMTMLHISFYKQKTLEFDCKTHSDAKIACVLKYTQNLKWFFFFKVSEIISEKLESHTQYVVSLYKEFCWPSLPWCKNNFGTTLIFDFEEQSFLSNILQTPRQIRHSLTFIIELSLSLQHGVQKMCCLRDLNKYYFLNVLCWKLNLASGHNLRVSRPVCRSILNW